MFGIERFFANALPTNLSSTEKAFKEDDVTKQIAFLNNVLEENPASAEAIRADLYKRIEHFFIRFRLSTYFKASDSVYN